jgi:hypothetical protein
MNAGPLSNGNQRRKHIDVIRELMKRPRTVKDLMDLCELGENALRDLLLILAESGLVHITIRVTEGGHRPANVFHWCPVPFEVPETAKTKEAA